MKKRLIKADTTNDAKMRWLAEELKQEDVDKVGLRFCITRNDCLKCNFDPICVHDNTPILFTIDRNDGLTWFCSSVETDYRLTAYFSTESIMKFGKKYDILTAAKEGSENENTEQVFHPSHYAWLKDLCGIEPLDICRHIDFNTGNAIKYLLRKDKVDGNKTKTENRHRKGHRSWQPHCRAGSRYWYTPLSMWLPWQYRSHGVKGLINCCASIRWSFLSGSGYVRRHCD